SASPGAAAVPDRPDETSRRVPRAAPACGWPATIWDLSEWRRNATGSASLRWGRPCRERRQEGAAACATNAGGRRAGWACAAVLEMPPPQCSFREEAEALRREPTVPAREASRGGQLVPEAPAARRAGARLSKGRRRPRP